MLQANLRSQVLRSEVLQALGSPGADRLHQNAGQDQQVLLGAPGTVCNSNSWFSPVRVGHPYMVATCAHVCPQGEETPCHTSRELSQATVQRLTGTQALEFAKVAQVLVFFSASSSSRTTYLLLRSLSMSRTTVGRSSSW